MRQSRISRKHKKKVRCTYGQRSFFEFETVQWLLSIVTRFCLKIQFFCWQKKNRCEWSFLLLTKKNFWSRAFFLFNFDSLFTSLFTIFLFFKLFFCFLTIFLFFYNFFRIKIFNFRNLNFFLNLRNKQRVEGKVCWCYFWGRCFAVYCSREEREGERREKECKRKK